jgi:2,5-dioxopentanoate dehydrogenase
VPIPVFAEMSSVNPVILLPHRLAEAAEPLGQAYAASLTLGAGQFCTNPGIVLAVAGSACDQFVAAAAAALESVASQTMLTPTIRANYEAGLARIAQRKGVEMAGAGADGQACIFTVDAAAFMDNPQIAEENFGPSSVVVRCADIDEIKTLLAAMEGQLTATLHMNEADYPAARALLPILERLAGRIIANGWPTGVDVAHAMVHGGPFPATSDGRSTSVGTMAIERFLRPVAYQDMPAGLLPDVLATG